MIKQDAIRALEDRGWTIIEGEGVASLVQLAFALGRPRRSRPNGPYVEV